MKDKLLCFVDKTLEPHHSFIDGMLAKQLADNFDVVIYTSWDSVKNIKKSRYHNAMLKPYLFPRIGIPRLLNFFSVFVICLNELLRNKGRKIHFFCRNEPTFLLGMTFLSLFFNINFVFQSSFPHEDVSGSIKGKVAKWMFKISKGRTKKITAVSNTGLNRMHKYFPRSRGIVLPLMGEGHRGVVPVKLETHQPLRFIYIGTLDSTREFEVVVSAFHSILSQTNLNISLDVYGGNISEWDSIVEKSVGINALDEVGGIQYKGSIERDKLISIMSLYDVGISQVPKNDITKEMSPTKLTEYMECGLAVLASSTVDSQVDIVRASNCGVLSDFSIVEISNAIQKIYENKKDLYNYKKNSIDFIDNQFSYLSMKDDLVRFIRS